MHWLKKIFGGQRSAESLSWPEWMEAARWSDGHAREAAVRVLGHSGHGAALPVLLERANDWVPQVRGAACAAIRRFLADEHIADWIAAMPQVAALHRACRVDHSALLEEIHAFIAAPARLAEFKAARPGMAREARRLVTSIELQVATGEALHAALLEALRSDDVMVALRAWPAFERVDAPDTRAELMRQACGS